MISNGRQRLRRVFQEIDRTRSALETLPVVPIPAQSSISSNYAPPSPELNVTLSTIETPSPLKKTLANRISQFDDIFRNLLRSRSEKDARESKQKSRRVSFNPIAQVVLIPSCQEYHDADLATLLWWTRRELKSFQMEARHELQQMLRYAMYTRRFAPPVSLSSLAVPLPDSEASERDSSPRSSDSPCLSPSTS